jgi:hypothetical protein
MGSPLTAGGVAGSEAIHAKANDGRDSEVASVWFPADLLGLVRQAWRRS